MTTTAPIARAAKRLVKRSVPPGLWRRVRDVKQRVAGNVLDRSLRRDVARLVTDRDASVPLRENFDLLLALHDRFERQKFVNSYDPDVIFRIARDRFDWLKGHGVDPAGMEVVEYGAGHAAMLFVAGDYGVKRAVALDYKEREYQEIVARRGEPKGDHEFVSTDLTAYDPPRGAFDLCLCDNSFEHFADPAAVLDKCHQTLRPGGVLLARFNPIFHSALGAHRYGFTGVPFVQNIFGDETNWRFFQDHLDISGGRNMYTGDLIEDGDPFPEMNRWRAGQYEAIFLDEAKWQPVHWQRQHDRRFAWFAKLFRDAVPDLTEDDWFVSGYEFLLRRR